MTPIADDVAYRIANRLRVDSNTFGSIPALKVTTETLPKNTSPHTISTVSPNIAVTAPPYIPTNVPNVAPKQVIDLTKQNVGNVGNRIQNRGGISTIRLHGNNQFTPHYPQNTMPSFSTFNTAYIPQMGVRPQSAQSYFQFPL